MNLVHLPYGRLAIRDGDALLSVPPMHPATSREDRRRVLEYVLRRQVGLAHTIAEMAREDIERHRRIVPGLAEMIEQAPHRSEARAA